MLDKATIIKNSTMLNGNISKNLPTAWMKIDPAISKNELNTAKIKYLFLKNPTLAPGYMVDRHAKA